MYTTDHIFPVLPIKDLINEDGDPTTPYKLETGMKPPVSHLRVLFCLCGVQKATGHVETKTLTCVTKLRRVFAASSWEYHSTKKDTLGMYPVLER